MANEKRHIWLGAYLLYTLNFTTFVSGPIQRYDEFARDQFATEPIALGPRVVGLQLERIVRGFFKVNVLAMLLLAMHQDALAQMSQPVPLSLKLSAAFLLAVLYPFFVYANFSGYIDIVIALARLMRVRLPENFDRPFSASSFLGFLEPVAYYALHVGQNICVQSAAVGADAAHLVGNSAAVLGRFLLFCDVLPGRRLAWAHLGIHHIRRAAWWGGVDQ